MTRKKYKALVAERRSESEKKSNERINSVLLSNPGIHEVNKVFYEERWKNKFD